MGSGYAQRKGGYTPRICVGFDNFRLTASLIFFTNLEVSVSFYASFSVFVYAQSLGPSTLCYATVGRSQQLLSSC